MNRAIRLSVIIPVYNEIRTIEEIISRVLKQREVYEIVIVDDGSKDGTREILKKLYNKKIKIILHDKNRGKGAAILTGLQNVSGTHVIIQDADLEYDPRDYQQMVKPIIEGVADVVYGSRFYGPHRDMFFWHKLGNDLINFTIDILFNSILSDCETCYKIIPTDLMKSLNLTAKKFDFEVEITCKILKKQIRIYEVPISYAGREYNDGKKIKFSDGIVAILRIFQYRFF